jgi:hypothetical protein
MLFPCQVQQGLIWIFPTSDETLAVSKELPLIQELEDPDCVDATNIFVQDMPYSWQILVENLCDPAHVNLLIAPLWVAQITIKRIKCLISKWQRRILEEFKAQKDPYPSREEPVENTFNLYDGFTRC